MISIEVSEKMDCMNCQAFNPTCKRIERETFTGELLHDFVIECDNAEVCERLFAMLEGRKG